MRRRGAFLFPILILLFGASLIREASVGWLIPAEDAWQATLARRLTSQASPADVTLIEVNADTLDKHVWPWKAEDMAVFFSSCLPARPGGKPFEPAVLGIEPILDFTRGALAGEDGDPDTDNETDTTKTEGSPEDSKDINVRALQDLMRRTPKLVLGGRLGWEQEEDTAQPLIPMPVLKRAKVHGDTDRLAKFTTVDLRPARSLRLGTLGWVNYPDAPGPRGLCPLLVRYRGQPVPTFPLQLVIFWAKATLDDVEVNLGENIIIGGKLRIPIDEAGRMQVNFGLNPARVAYDDLLVARYQMDNGNKPNYPPALFDKKVLLLARADNTARNLETPTGLKISAGELAAYAIATIQAKAQPQRIGAWFDWALVGLATIASYWLPRWRTSLMAVLVIVCDVAYLGGALALFRLQSLTLPAVLPLGLAMWMLLLRVFAKRMQRVIAF